ncbi:MAG: ATP-dependent sacrificial sulfur transferase LarE [Armatimonadota bacterium]
METKIAHLQQLLRDLGRVVVAFSGGVDSTYLLRVALDTLGRENVLAVIADSESYPTRELEEAKQLAEEMDANYRVVRSEELADERYAANPKNRCYYCKSELFSKLQDIARAEGYAAVLDGSNADDTGDWRPGQQAGCELGVRSLLQEAGMSKAEIRAHSRALGLATWNKPSYACLASRIPYGTQITEDTLNQIDAAETVLIGLGFSQVRVRYHGEVARIEVLPEEIGRMLEPALRDQVLEQLRALGFKYVTLDLQGYRTGSMNEVLAADNKSLSD